MHRSSHDDSVYHKGRDNFAFDHHFDGPFPDNTSSRDLQTAPAPSPISTLQIHDINERETEQVESPTLNRLVHEFGFFNQNEKVNTLRGDVIYKSKRLNRTSSLASNVRSHKKVSTRNTHAWDYHQHHQESKHASLIPSFHHQSSSISSSDNPFHVPVIDAWELAIPKKVHKEVEKFASSRPNSSRSSSRPSSSGGYGGGGGYESSGSDCSRPSSGTLEYDRPDNNNEQQQQHVNNRMMSSSSTQNIRSQIGRAEFRSSSPKLTRSLKKDNSNNNNNNNENDNPVVVQRISSIFPPRQQQQQQQQQYEEQQQHNAFVYNQVPKVSLDALPMDMFIRNTSGKVSERSSGRKKKKKKSRIQSATSGRDRPPSRQRPPPEAVDLETMKWFEMERQ